MRASRKQALEATGAPPRKTGQVPSKRAADVGGRAASSAAKSTQASLGLAQSEHVADADTPAPDTQSQSQPEAAPSPDAHAPSPATPEDAPRLSLSQRALGAADPAPYLNGLNPEQREAVETLEGPVLVLAGAGTGKTRVLTTRIAHILATGKAYPSQILAVTFTNKAAREMKHRVGQFVGSSVEGMPWLGTFHSIAARVLRYHAELVGLKPQFTVLDVDDQLRLMKQVIQAARLDIKRWTPRHLASLIDSWKN
ncbi:MAG: UvrD-helicase domain-containing protein, partial [Alphaproteobacteria bacterium]